MESLEDIWLGRSWYTNPGPLFDNRMAESSSHPVGRAYSEGLWHPRASTLVGSP